MLDNVLFMMPMVTGVIFACTGWFMLRYPPKNINALYGYRTQTSMKSPEHWAFAQRYAATLLARMGLGLLIFSLLGLFWHPSSEISAILSIGLMTIVVIILVWRVESALKKKFPK